MECAYYSCGTRSVPTTFVLENRRRSDYKWLSAIGLSSLVVLCPVIKGYSVWIETLLFQWLAT
jgi:hypothetical protein